MRIEGRAALDYPAYRRLVWTSGKGRLLRMWAAALLIGLGALLLRPAAGAVLLVALLVAVPLFFELSLRRVWRRLAAGGPAAEIGYELTDDGMTVSLAGVSTRHRWESLRPLRETAGYWLFRGLLTRRVIAVPRDAFEADARAEADAVFAGMR
ncbi:YcxB family protein [Micromonospora sp. RTP1Z1]|uniref:YcxB family protein n=1 Tax=Micromonospora sp. RTP1Z1 TaxID=2994043 RepID=UPI0029C68965|nr:YcxB family protein [Micromonospora sp. RTP1Z1]